MIALLLTIILVALLLWAVRQIGLPPDLQRVFEVVVVVLLILWVITRLFGLPF